MTSSTTSASLMASPVPASRASSSICSRSNPRPGRARRLDYQRPYVARQLAEFVGKASVAARILQDGDKRIVVEVRHEPSQVVAEQRAQDDAQCQPAHRQRDVHPTRAERSSVPLRAERFVFLAHDRRIALDGAAVKCGLQHPALAAPELAFTGHDAAAEQQPDPVDADTLGVVAVVRHQHVLDVVRVAGDPGPGAATRHVHAEQLAEVVESTSQDDDRLVRDARLVWLQRRGRCSRTGDFRSVGVHWRQGRVTRYPWQKSPSFPGTMTDAIILHASLRLPLTSPPWQETLLHELPYAHRLELERRESAARRASLAGLGLVLVAAARVTRREFPPRAFRFSPAGQPSLAGGPRCSISHSPSRVVCVVCADTDCGIDIEDVHGIGQCRDGDQAAALDRDRGHVEGGRDGAACGGPGRTWSPARVCSRRQRALRTAGAAAACPASSATSRPGNG